MKELGKLPASGYVVIRCADMAIVAQLQSFPVCERSMMYRRGDEVSFMPLSDDDIVGTPSMFTRMLEIAGYRVSHHSDMISP